MEMYPVFLKLEQKFCLVAGGGKVAERKVKSLLRAGARVTVVAPECTPEIEKMAGDNVINLSKRAFTPTDAEGAFLVIAATDREEVNREIYEAAEKTGILINTVDVPDKCSFFVPASVNRGRLTVAISTSGTAPYFARALREHFETLLYPELGKDLEKIEELRKKILESSPSEEEKSKLFKKLLDPEIQAILGRVSKR